MYNDNFYPTPESVCRKMLAHLSHNDLVDKYILEPSAGKGDLASAIARKIEKSWHGFNNKKRIHCVEIHPDLQASIRGNGFSLVGQDFLDFNPETRYDLIIMNPPFSHGLDHLLHAWDILHGGQIVCLLPETVVTDPTPTKKQLVIRELIKQYGEYELLGDCFNTDEAFRQTAVRVVLIRLSKPTPKPGFTFLNPDLETETRKQFDFSNMENEIARRDIIADTVQRYSLVMKSAEKAFVALAELAYFSNGVGKLWDTIQKPIESVIENKRTDAFTLNHTFNDFSEAFKHNAWLTLMRKSNISGLLSQKVHQDFDRMVQENGSLAFSEKNIHNIFAGIFASAPEIIRQCIMEAFDNLTQHYHENRLFVEGWKTNDAWRVNRRVILGWIVSCDPFLKIRYEKTPMLDDLDRALAFLSGKHFKSVNTIVQAFEKHYAANKGKWHTTPFESEFFDCRAYKKGTLHLYFKDEHLWDTFNIEAAKGKNWLPDDYKTREKQAREEAKSRSRNGDDLFKALALPCPDPLLLAANG